MHVCMRMRVPIACSQILGACMIINVVSHDFKTFKKANIIVHRAMWIEILQRMVENTNTFS